MIFARQIAFIDSLETQFFASLRKSIEANGNFIVDSITQKQLFERGEDGDGKKLLGYTRTTIRIKVAKGQPFDRTTLRDENEFHPSIMIDARDRDFTISSNVTHAQFLVARYGENIMKPSNETMSEFFRLYFLPNIKTELDGQITR